MELLPKEPYKRIFCIVFYLILALVGFYIFFRFAFPVLLPFIIALAVACVAQRPARFVSEKTGMSIKLLSVFFGLLFLFSAGLVISLCVSKLIAELSSFVGGIMERREEIFENIMGFSDKTDSFLSRIIPGNDPTAEKFRASLSEFIIDASKNIISGITTKIPAFMGNVFSRIPKMLFSILAMILSCIYFCLDFNTMSAFFANKLSKKPFSAFSGVKKAYFSTVGKYMRACFMIFLMTATELTVGFLIIGVKYALLAGVITAFIDILPVFGSGTVLIPYAILEFIKGNFKLGIGLVILYAVVTFVRQISEPRIMGKNLGVHPLLSLFCVYAGYRLFGVTGMIFLPITVVIIKNIFVPERKAAKA